ncbi:MAG: hypothetical protein WCV81_05100 [Microgenomates group bacterium]|jgi:hypothetical protein
MTEDINKACAFLNEQASIQPINQSTVPIEFPSPEERRIDNLVSDIIHKFGIDSRLLNMDRLAPKKHPLTEALILTLPIPIVGEGVKATLMAGFIPVSRADSVWPDSSYRVTVEMKRGKSKQCFTLLNLDHIGKVRDRFKHKFIPEQLEGCEAVLRCAMENGDPNSQKAAWKAHNERFSKASSFIERIKIATMG